MLQCSKSLTEITKELYGIVRLLSKKEIDFPNFHEKIRKHFADMFSDELVKPLQLSKDIIIPKYNVQIIRKELLLRYLVDEERN